MKLLFFYISTILVSVAISSLYDIKFEALDGTIIKMNAYQGKKIVVAVISANSDGLLLAHYLDSVQKANTSVQVIIIPTADFKGSVSSRDLKDLKKNISVTVAKPLKVKKSNGYLQHPLFVWLTEAKENTHLNVDVETEGEVF